MSLRGCCRRCCSASGCLPAMAAWLRAEVRSVATAQGDSRRRKPKASTPARATAVGNPTGRAPGARLGPSPPWPGAAKVHPARTFVNYLSSLKFLLSPTRRGGMCRAVVAAGHGLAPMLITAYLYGTMMAPRLCTDTIVEFIPKKCVAFPVTTKHYKTMRVV